MTEAKNGLPKQFAVARMFAEHIPFHGQQKETVERDERYAQTIEFCRGERDPTGQGSNRTNRCLNNTSSKGVLSTDLEWIYLGTATECFRQDQARPAPILQALKALRHLLDDAQDELKVETSALA
ncbi:MAG: hypothetical protein ACE368_14940 [Paracoccaceae bacterium]